MANQFSDQRFTPRPWHVGKPNEGARVQLVYNVDGYAVCDCKTYHGASSTAEMQANAALIAAAPDMYAALETLVKLIDDLDHSAIGPETDRVFPSYEFAEARAALKKARGESCSTARIVQTN